MDMDQIRAALSKMSNDQLRQVSGMVKDAWDRNTRVASREFMVGEYATWKSTKTGRPVYIRITKVNTKTILGEEVNAAGERVPSPGWRVSPNLLKPYTPK